MESLKQKWNGLEQGVKIGLGAVAALVTVLFVIKLLPALIAAMGIGAFLAILFVPYWLPTIIAFYRKHPSKGGIFALNFFLGWTFLGWVLSLVWSLSDASARAGAQSVVVNTTVNAGNTEVPRYQPGDVVNGLRFDGATWVPVAPVPSPAASVGTPLDPQASAASV
ncbi:MAG TPA: superinfection immunity protein [Solirubrobacteraceae bacterium]|nr:superinfection immunity protein [Solirubrobacteraceae bacterium]